MQYLSKDDLNENTISLQTLNIGSVGLGFRRDFAQELLAQCFNHTDPIKPQVVDFLEIAPENWLSRRGREYATFETLNAQLPCVCHGLSLSLGGAQPLNFNFLKSVKQFLRDFEITLYSEHMSAATDGTTQMYELLPIPFTESMAQYLADRILRVQDYLGQRIAIENSSYYAVLSNEMTELDFLLSVLDKADCYLLLDVNNVFVNATNHKYSAIDFIQALPSHKIAYCHIAGHLERNDQRLIDTHGAPVAPSVWALLAATFHCHGVLPTLLERDFNFPPIASLISELNQIRRLQSGQLQIQSGCI